MTDGTKLMSNLSGLSPAMIHEIWAQVKLNHARLDACPDHHFERTAESTEARTRYRCCHCAGEIDGPTHRWYMLGRAHGRSHGATTALASVTST